MSNVMSSNGSNPYLTPIPYNDRLMAFLVYIPLETVLLSSNLLIVISIVFYIPHSQNAVYRFHLNHALVNIFQGCMHLILTLPITIIGLDIYNGTPFYWLYRSAVAYEYVNFKTSMMLVLFATLNGASIFLFPKFNDRLFSGKALKLIICGIWLDAIGETCIETFTDCNKAFRAEDLSFFYSCTSEQAAKFQFHNFDSFQRLGYPFIILIANILLFGYIRYVRHLGSKVEGARIKKGGGEMVLLVQGLLICVFTGGNGILFNFLTPFILTGPVMPIMFPLVLNVATMGLAIAQPLLNIFFNKSIQAGTLRMVTGKSPPPKTVKVTTISTMAISQRRVLDL